MATIFKELRSKHEVLVVDAGGVDAKSDKIMERENSGILLRLMDVMDYTFINLTPADILLTQNNTLKRTVFLSSNYQDKDSDLLVSKDFDYTDAKGRKIRFFGLYDGDDPRFLDAHKWLDVVLCPPERINVLLYYADRKPDESTRKLLGKFDAVIANLRLPEDVPNIFTPLAKGKQVAVLSVQDKKQMAGRDVPVDEHVLGDKDMFEMCWREQSALAKRQEELERTQYLHMTPEEFVKTYQKENQ